MPGDWARGDQLREFQAKVRQGHQRYLSAPEALRVDLESILAGWEVEAGELERRIANLQVVDGDLTRFAHSWDEVKGRIVAVGEPCINEPGGGVHLPKLPNVPSARVPWQMPSIFDKIRSLLKQLGLSVTICWKQVKVGWRVRWVVDRGRIEACGRPMKRGIVMIIPDRP